MTILDANITTLIVAIILYAIGTGPIKGFAVTLSVGIITSMFSSIMGTRRWSTSSTAAAGLSHWRLAASVANGPVRKERRHERHTLHEMALGGRGTVRGCIAGGHWFASIRQLNWGLDFTGGTLVEVAYSDSANLGAIRTVLDQEGYEGAVVVSFGTDKDVLVRLPDGYSDEQGALMVDKLRAATDMNIELRRIEFVGPQVVKS